MKRDKLNGEKAQEGSLTLFSLMHENVKTHTLYNACKHKQQI